MSNNRQPDDTVVYLGPSLPRVEAHKVLSADFRPPVAVGDVYRAVRRGVKTIAIVDGYFEQVPAVFHKEILFAIQNGVTVFGAASMGALRAAELDRFGMIGIGRIYERFRSGEYEADDEVAVAHGLEADGFRPLSDALVNLRDGLQKAEEHGIIDAPTRERLVELGRGLFYAERSWKALWRSAAGAGVARDVIDSLSDFVARTKPDLKREDAVALLHVVRDGHRVGPEPEAVPFVMEETVFWKRLAVEAECWTAQTSGPGADAPLDELCRRLLVGTEGASDFVRLGLLRALAVDEAQRLGLHIDSQLVQRIVDEFRRRKGLNTRAELEKWLAANMMSASELAELMRTEAALYKLTEYHGARLRKHVLDASRLSGRFVEFAERTFLERADERGLSEAIHTRDPNADSLSALVEWYKARVRARHVDLAIEATSLLFDGSGEFVNEISAAYAREKAARQTTV